MANDNYMTKALRSWVALSQCHQYRPLFQILKVVARPNVSLKYEVKKSINIFPSLSLLNLELVKTTSQLKRFSNNGNNLRKVTF